MKKTLSTYLPFFNWIRYYGAHTFRDDLIAGLTVGIMVIPQGMAYAMLAGLPPIYGLYACLVPMVVYAFLGTSRHLVIGPAAMVSILTGVGIAAVVAPETDMYIPLVLLLTFCVGLVQLLMGIFRLGFLVNFISNPVLNGFTSAVSLIIFFSQWKHLIGVDIPRSGHIHTIIIASVDRFDEIHWLTVGIGLVSMLLIFLLSKIHKLIPAALITIIVGIIFVWIFGLNQKGVDIVAGIPRGLPAFRIPVLELENVKSIWSTILTISLIGILTAVANAKAIIALSKEYNIDPNQEFRSLGLANLLGSFFQSYPTSGSFSRTVVNYQSGGKTGMSSIIAASLIALTLLFLTPLFYFLPKAILAAIIMLAIVKLIDVKEPRHLWKSNRTDFWMLIVTLLSTLFIGIEPGILIGIILSVVMVIYKSTRPHYVLEGKLPNSDVYRNVLNFPESKERDDILVFRFDATLYFANSEFFKNTFMQEVNKKGPLLKLVILNTECINDLDSTACRMIGDVLRDLSKKNIQFSITSTSGPVREALSRDGLEKKIGLDNYFLTVKMAVDSYDLIWQKIANNNPQIS